MVPSYLGTPTPDAAYESLRGSGGYLLVMGLSASTERRLGRVVKAPPPRICSIWGSQTTYIAQLELAVAFVAFVEHGCEFRNAPGMSFIDNTNALMALARGRSNSDSLDAMALTIHIALFVLPFCHSTL